jgi:hypothetical protein
MGFTAVTPHKAFKNALLVGGGNAFASIFYPEVNLALAQR